jgi:hypothetical protein
MIFEKHAFLHDSNTINDKLPETNYYENKHSMSLPNIFFYENILILEALFEWLCYLNFAPYSFHLEIFREADLNFLR